MKILECHNLTKKFGNRSTDFSAVHSVNLSIESGDIYALIGANGAGKTTLVKMIAGLLKPTEGTVKINDHDMSLQPLLAKSHFGYVPDEPFGYDFLTGFEFLRFSANLRGMSVLTSSARIEALLKIFPISDMIYRPMSEYSRGVKQKVLILAALLSKPEILIIDEPIVGLDPKSMQILGRLMRKYADSGHVIFFVTHILDFVKSYATRVGVMNKGSLVKEVILDKASKLDSLL